ncbi:hypothetical protein [Polaribacter uvawellassae]|uniref:hypothetical protein n=1 Tax=Polaribacter uvawellassae TaxID=3133495 RepID=UPI00321A0922
MEKEKIVIEYETKQRVLKKLVKKTKKKIPYSIFGLIFFCFALIALLDGKLNKIVGNSYNLVLVISILLVLLTSTYLILMYQKINKINRKIKSLGEKMYNKMKL